MLQHFKIFLFISFMCFLPPTLFAQSLEVTSYLDRTQLVSEQINLLKNRFTQASDELSKLQYRQQKELSSLSIDKVNKQQLTQTRLEIAIAKSDLDSISIEITESQQTINRLEKGTQEIANQLNVVGIFGSKIVHMNRADVDNLRGELYYQQKLLELEKKRYVYLQQLQTTADKTLQCYKLKSVRIEELLKSQTMMQLKEQQAQSELAFQQQQTHWLQQLNQLNNQLSELQLVKKPDKALYQKLEADIFYLNENVNFSYLQMLVARYQDQIEQLTVSVSRGSSINLLNNINDQVQILGKQLTRVGELLKARMVILEKRKQFHWLTKQKGIDYATQLKNLGNQYQVAYSNMGKFNQALAELHKIVNKALQQELSSRQGLPSLEASVWLNIGAETLLLPTLTFHVVKSLVNHFIQTLSVLPYAGWLLLTILETLWIFAFYYLGRFSMQQFSQLNNIEFGHVNLRWLSFKLLHRNLIDLAVLGNIVWLFYLCSVPTQSFAFVINLTLTWLFFKTVITLARFYLVETVHDRAGADVRLYHHLKWTFIMGGVITLLAVLVYGLPVSYEVKDLFARLFLLFLLFISFVLLKSWEVLPGLITPHIDERRAYLRRMVRLLGVVIPLILIVNSAVGLFGYVNLVYTISWYEGVFLFVMASYLILRGLFIDVMEFFSTLLIRHIANGWLWTEAFLKPLDRVLRIALFLMAWAMLFLCYGWDSQSHVVDRLYKLIHYQLGEVLNIVITPLSLVELLVMVSLLYWAAKWTREFVYRLLLPRTQDIGIRNSIAILSQYAMIAVGIFIGLRVLGVDFRALAVVAGMFAFGVGLGLRDLVNNFASGFLLLIERPLRVGDVVTIDGYEGDVVHIGGRAVTIRTWDHIDVLVPNAEIFSKTFVNWTAKDNIVRTVIKIQIDCHDNPLQIQALIYEVLFQNKNVLKDPIPEVFLNELLDGVIEIEVRYYVNLRLIRSRIEIRSEVLIAIWQIFEKNGIKAPYPAREVYLKESIPQVTQEPQYK